MALTNYHIKNGYIYENETAKEFSFINGVEMKIQGTGTGTYKVIGTFGNGTPKELFAVDMSTLDIEETCENDTVYCIDVIGLTSVTVTDVSSDIEKIYADIYVK